MSGDSSMFPKPDVLNSLEYGKYVLTNLAARRARQLKDGAPPLVRIESSHPLSIALEEIAAGKIKPVMGEELEHFEEQEEAALEALKEGLLLPGIDDDDDDFDGPSLDDLDLGDDDEDDDEDEEDDNDDAPSLKSLIDDDEDEPAAGEDDDEDDVEPEVEGADSMSLDDLAAQDDADEDED
jgi:DNA-directed RNA polymerase omega subunit